LRLAGIIAGVAKYFSFIDFLFNLFYHRIRLFKPKPLIDKIGVSLISWEIIIDTISAYDKEMRKKLLMFYEACCKLNKPG